MSNYPPPGGWRIPWNRAAAGQVLTISALVYSWAVSVMVR